MIRSIYFPHTGEVQLDIKPEKISSALLDPKGMLWVSLEAPTPEESKLILGDIFKFHHLAIEDCLSVGYQSPKVDDFGDYLFIIAHAIKSDKAFDQLKTMELNLFLGKNYLVTSHMEKTLHPIAHIRENLSRDNRLYANGVDFLCHAILDVLVDDYMPVIDKMDEEIEWMEELVLAKPTPMILERILNLKHSLLAMRRIISPQREIMNRLSRDDFPQIDRQSSHLLPRYL